MNRQQRFRCASRRIVFGVESLEPRAMFAVSDLDLTFGNGTGRRTFSFLGANDSESASAVAVQPDGKIVAAGTFTRGAGASNFAVARFNNDGSLDTSFGNGGQVVIDTAGANETATCMTLQTNGKIVIGGYATISGQDDFVVARLNLNGTLDTSFNLTGIKTFNFAGGGTNNDQATGITTQTIDGSNRIVVVGLSDQFGNDNGFDFGVLRLTDSGSVDKSFAENAGGDDYALTVDIDSQNRIVVGGTTDIGGNTDFTVIRFTPAGVFDLNFNGGIRAFINFSSNDDLRAIQVVAGDKIVAAGYDNASAAADFALARLNADGTLDTTFNDLAAPTLSNGDGKLAIDLGSTDLATGLAVQSDGKLVVSGFTGAGNVKDFVVARVTTAGTVDTSFSPSGFRTYDIGGADSSFGMALDGLERIVLAGSIRYANSTTDFALARVKAFENVASELKVVNGALFFTDLLGAANNLTVSRTTTSLVFADTATLITSNFGGPSNTVSIPLSEVGKLVINTQGGDDRVRLSISSTGFTFTSGFVVNLGTGKDTLLITANTDLTVSNTKIIAGAASGLLAGAERVILQGGAGANRLDTRGFTGAAVLDGGAGNDTLLAGKGRSILIGGLGVDTLVGGSSQDIGIGGKTTLNILQPAFVLLVDKWAGPGSYAARLAAIRNATGLPPGLKLVPATVPDDKAVDSLFGSDDQDWFWTYPKDVLQDKAANETVG